MNALRRLKIKKKKLAIIEEYDKETRLTSNAHELALKKNLAHDYRFADFGRTLAHYVRVHDALLHCFHGKLKGKRILRLASSSGIYAKFLQDQGVKAVAFDIGSDAAEIAKKMGNKRILRASARLNEKGSSVGHANRLPFKDSSFDAFLSDHFLFSHFPLFEDFNEELNHGITNSKSIKAMHELHRILKPGGIGIIENCYKNELNVEKINEAGFDVISRMGPELSRQMIVVRKR